MTRKRKPANYRRYYRHIRLSDISHHRKEDGFLSDNWRESYKRDAWGTVGKPLFSPPLFRTIRTVRERTKRKKGQRKRKIRI